MPPKSLGFVLWGLRMSAQNLMAIHPAAVEMFQPGPTWWPTNWHLHLCSYKKHKELRVVCGKHKFMKGTSTLSYRCGTEIEDVDGNTRLFVDFISHSCTENMSSVLSPRISPIVNQTYGLSPDSANPPHPFISLSVYTSLPLSPPPFASLSPLLLLPGRRRGSGRGKIQTFRRDIKDKEKADPLL